MCVAHSGAAGPTITIIKKLPSLAQASNQPGVGVNKKKNTYKIEAITFLVVRKIGSYSINLIFTISIYLLTAR